MKTKRLTKFRLLILAAFVIFITYQAYMHQVKGGGPDGAPSIHALCPYGGLESLYTLFASGELIDKIYLGTMALFIITVITAIVFRRGFCGWICPLGGLQEFFARLGRKLMRRQLTMPRAIDKYLRYLKYAVLILTAVYSWRTASIWVGPYDPWAAYGHLGEGLPAVWKEFPVGLSILLITFIGSFFYDRFFCKYLCPMGGLLGIISKISPFKIKRDESACISCNLCTKVCPVNIDVAKVQAVTSAECINCQECTSVCPEKGALTNIFSVKNKTAIKPMVVGISILVVYFGGIAIAKAAGLYPLLPEAITEETVITDVDTLKGYMSLSDISTVMNIPLEEVYSRMQIPAEVPGDIPVKEISKWIPDFDFHEAREALSH
ncbi:MAG: 4Fe-4S binding protein [Spirochaetales bacterium]|nr:4Fe-4S binding protein [Spirochaetales bacterium]